VALVVRPEQVWVRNREQALMVETGTGTDKKPGQGANFGTFVRKKSEAFPVFKGEFGTDPGQAFVSINGGPLVSCSPDFRLDAM